jgi:hypothetical protein
MIKLERNKSMMRAIDRARQLRPHVKFMGERRFAVESARHAGTTYTVVFAVDADGRKFGACTCPAGHNGQACYHLAAAAQVNIMTQSMRQGASAPIAARIQRSIESDRSGQRYTVVRCNGWAI